MKEYIFQVLENEQIPWDKIQSTYDATPYKTQRWSRFLKATQNVSPFIIEIRYDTEVIGWFYAQKIKRFGIPMVVSPFEGWTTSFQGLSLVNETESYQRVAIYQQIIEWLFSNGICWYVQVSDWHLNVPDVEKYFEYSPIYGYKLDLTRDFETEIYKNFKEKSAKYSIKKARKLGVIIKPSKDIRQFADNYYSQLLEVFAKQGLTPTYDKQRIISLGENLELGKDLFLLEAYHPSTNDCIATGLFLRNDRLAIYYGAASLSAFQNMCPNELLMYEAIKLLAASGAKEMEFGGGRKYKEKYGPEPYVIPKIVAAKYSVIIKLKNLAKYAYYASRELRAKFKSNR